MSDNAAKAKYPRDAASLILVRRRNDEAEVLMGRRPRRQTFMPDVYVFPGGAVDRRDGYAEIASDYHPAVNSALTRHCTPHRARALGLAAIRETYEETGLMFGLPAQSFTARPPEGWAAFAEAGVKPSLDALGLVARAITPKGPPRRFHARFFVGDARHLQGDLRDTDELLDLRWVPLNRTDTLPLANVTELVLREVGLALSRQPEEDAGLGIPFITRRMGKRVIRYEMGNGRIVRGLFEAPVDADEG
ncbi:MAG: NUDIX domain-containing protein [Alphaproteobacteria bacterium]